MKYMMLSQMMKGKNGGLGDVLPLLMMGGSFGDGLFEGLFDEEDPEETSEAEQDPE